MSSDAYFAAAEHPYWQWQDDGNVVAWTDGSTIVFRAELLPVFRRLESQSLPPFGAVVLLLAACRDNWNEPPRKVEYLEQILASGGRLDRRPLLEKVCASLDRVRALDSKLRTSAEAKAELAAMVFEEQGESALPEAYERLIGALEQGLGEYPLQPQRLRPAVDRLLRDLAWLERGLARVDGAALALRLKTGLEQPLAPPQEIVLSPAAAARRLLAQLQDDEELGAVARLARLLLAAVHLPTPLSVPEELPLGGVSDISNRGSLDRLLLSELANDGLTLAVRVAMNEALYLRRETPPNPPSRRRLVLLDAGLRMWGVPRVFATSVGLAVAAGAADHIDVDLYRAAGDDLAPVDMTTAAGLTDHLAALDHRIHPGNSLPALVDEAAAAGDATDVVVVTGDDVYADPEFQRLLGEARFDELHVATVGRDGAFRLHLQSRRGKKLLRQAQFALDDVLRPPTKPTVGLLKSAKPDLPAIFAADPFPLLLSYQVDVERSWYVDDFGALTYARDGRLLHWTDYRQGVRQIAEDLPPGNLHWAATRARGGGIQAIIGKLSRDGLRLLTVYQNGTTEHVRLEIEINQPKYAFLHQGVVFVGDDHELNACSGANGKFMAKRSLAGLKHVRGRLYAFHRPTSNITLWKAAAFNGTQIEFVEFHREATGGDRLLTVFETDEFEGPLAVTQAGMLVDFGTARRRRIAEFAPGSTVQGISRSGRRLSFTRPQGKQLHHVDVGTAALVNETLEFKVFDTARSVTMRHRFTAIGVDTLGRLTLVGRREAHWPLLSISSQIQFPPQPDPTALRCRYSFESIDDDDAKRYGLQVATFGDGSRAFLDTRGLLHLKSSDERIPEMTICLSDDSMAGWLSNGRIWGAGYFTGEPLPVFPDLSAIPVKQFVTEYLEPLVNRLV